MKSHRAPHSFQNNGFFSIQTDAKDCTQIVLKNSMYHYFIIRKCSDCINLSYCFSSICHRFPCMCLSARPLPAHYKALVRQEWCATAAATATPSATSAPSRPSRCAATARRRATARPATTTTTTTTTTAPSATTRSAGPTRRPRSDDTPRATASVCRH